MRVERSRPWSETVRIFLARWVFSSLNGITARRSWQLLREHRRDVDPRYWPRAAAIALSSLANSAAGALEARRFARALERVLVEPPLFVLGHWRSGTTYLHHLLSLDRSLASPSLFQVLFPHTFLSTERIHTRIWKFLLPRTRLIDEMPLGFHIPYEDEFALAAATLRSPYLSYVFPREWRRFDRYLTFREVPEETVREWKAAFLWFARKLTLSHGKPLIFKSPPHTCRIRLLLEIFPEARFVHIHRNPYDVFRSTRTMVEIGLPLSQLERWDAEGLDDLILERYRTLYDAYFEERRLVPPGRLHELGYEDLERDPLGEVEKVYLALALPGFDGVIPALERHLEEVAGYRTNVHRELPDALRARIGDEWGRSFEAWGYAR